MLSVRNDGERIVRYIQAQALLDGRANQRRFSTSSGRGRSLRTQWNVGAFRIPAKRSETHLIRRGCPRGSVVRVGPTKAEGRAVRRTERNSALIGSDARAR